ncbi:MAG: Glycerol kinase [Trizodia sp. TS-e1964]|nr:MAG: Glycerol kinase [Trizodia sp. TS-e1964]
MNQELQAPFVGSIDQGTTSSRFIIFDSKGMPAASHQVEFKQMYPKPGWHEHDPYDLIKSVESCIAEATAVFTKIGYLPSDIKVIGVTNQRETTVLWDTQTGEPVCNAIVWPDTRTDSLVRELKSRKGASGLQQICGLPLSTYPSAVKMLWLCQNNPRVREAYNAKRLSFGTVDSWLIYSLNGGPKRSIHATDSTNASRTMLLNLHSLQYDNTLLDFFQLDRNHIHLPHVFPSSDDKAFGSVESGPLAGVRITGCLGDQSAALVGQSAFLPGMAKNTYGTGCFLLYNVGDAPVISKHGLLATVAYDFGPKHSPVYALEGSIAVAGSGVKFLTSNLRFATESSKIGDLALTVEDNGGVVFVTAFSGLFAPYWIDDARGTICMSPKDGSCGFLISNLPPNNLNLTENHLVGITHHTEQGHIARATLEATCYQTKAILDAMEKDSGHKLTELAVDGGMSESDLCMQIQSDVIGISVDRPAMRETTALGSAIAAGLAVKIWRDFKELEEMNKLNRTVFTPKISHHQSKGMFQRWQKAVNMSRGWVDMNESQEENTPP